MNLYLPAAGRSEDRIRVYLPENLPDNFLPPGWAEYGEWLVSHLYLQRHLDRRYSDGSFSPLHSEVLERILPHRDYVKILKECVTANIIETNSSYFRGEGGRRGRSKSFRLAAKYREAKFRQHEVYHPELARKLARQRSKQEARFRPVHHHLRQMLDGVEVVGEDSMVLLPLVIIANGEYWFTVCEQGRVHTPLTNLSRELRQHIRWQGQELWMIDIKNSLPLFLALTVKGQVVADKSNVYLNVAPKTPPATATNPTPHHNRPTPTPYVLPLSSNCLNDDMFLERCASGEIYECLMQATGLSRDVVKKRCFAIAYGRPDHMNTKVGRAFRDKFPASCAEIRALKLPQGTDADHGYLARLMQQKESDLVIGRVCERLRKEAPKACLLTIHDCLVSTADHIGHFKRVLREEFAQVHGVEPQLKIKPFAC